jgi:hypothetical protein
MVAKWRIAGVTDDYGEALCIKDLLSDRQIAPARIPYFYP